MTCRQCQGLENLFDAKTATNELKDYRKKGPSKTTKMLVEALTATGVEGLTLLDIGGGVGAIQHELAKAGVSQVVNVDASTAYLDAAKSEAARQGYANRASYHYGDFIEIAVSIEPVDIVTLDRTICCYPDMPALVGLSSARAAKFYGLVYPCDSWWTKFGVAVINLFSRLFYKDYRFFAHATHAVEAILSENGLKQCFYRRTFLWQVALYAR